MKGYLPTEDCAQNGAMFFVNSKAAARNCDIKSPVKDHKSCSPKCHQTTWRCRICFCVTSTVWKRGHHGPNMDQHGAQHEQV